MSGFMQFWTIFSNAYDKQEYRPAFKNLSYRLVMIKPYTFSSTFFAPDDDRRAFFFCSTLP